MTLNDVRTEISRRTGVPTSLLTGTTVEENIDQAKAILDFKRDFVSRRSTTEPSLPKSPREQFAEWASKTLMVTDPNSGTHVPGMISEPDAPPPVCPTIADPGEIASGEMPDGRSTREQFTEWFLDRTAFNPFKDRDGWMHLL